MIIRKISRAKLYISFLFQLVFSSIFCLQSRAGFGELVITANSSCILSDKELVPNSFGRFFYSGPEIHWTDPGIKSNLPDTIRRARKKGSGALAKVNAARSFHKIQAEAVSETSTDNQIYSLVATMLTSYPEETKKRFGNNMFMLPMITFNQIDEKEFNLILERGINRNKIGKSNVLINRFYLVKIIYLLKYYLSIYKQDPGTWNLYPITAKFEKLIDNKYLTDDEKICYRKYFYHYLHTPGGINKEAPPNDGECGISEEDCLKIFVD